MSTSKASITIRTSWILGITALFFILKIAKVIDWSWLWVFSPVWISVGLVLSVWLLAIITMMLIAVLRR